MSGFATLGAAFGAGGLSVLSPCVLPLLPIVLAGAAAQGRGAALALAAGLAVAFAASGIFLATIGFAIGLDSGAARPVAAILMIGLGAALLAPGAQSRIGQVLAPLGAVFAHAARLADGRGVGGSFLLGALLGLAWSPCVGPTLGAAAVLAAQGKDLPMVAMTMTAFGIGAALPLLALGAVSHARLAAMRARLGDAGRGGRIALGLGLVVFGVLVATGFDKALEAAILDRAPDWLVRLTTAL